jgi:hypothetical protein
MELIAVKRSGLSFSASFASARAGSSVWCRTPSLTAATISSASAGSSGPSARATSGESDSHGRSASGRSSPAPSLGAAPPKPRGMRSANASLARARPASRRSLIAGGI